MHMIRQDFYPEAAWQRCAEDFYREAVAGDGRGAKAIDPCVSVGLATTRATDGDVD